MDRYDLLAAFDHWGVVTPQSKALKTRLEDFHRSGVGRYEGKCLVVTGTDGTGKTWGLRELVANHPECEGPTGVVRPVLYVEAPASCTLRSLSGEILSELGISPGKANQVVVTRRVLGQLRDQGVRTLIIDEFQHLLDQRTMKIEVDAANWVKRIVNANVCGVVLAGQPYAQAVVASNAELRRRTVGMIEMRAFDWADKDDRLAYRVFLDQMDKNAIRLPTRSNLGAPDTALRIHHFSRGKLGDTCLLVRTAFGIAIDAEAPCIAPEHFAQAVERLTIKTGERAFNPFLVGHLEPAAPARPDGALQAMIEHTLLPPKRENYDFHDERANAEEDE